MLVVSHWKVKSLGSDDSPGITLIFKAYKSILVMSTSSISGSNYITS